MSGLAPLDVRCESCRFLISRPCVIDAPGSSCDRCRALDVKCSLEDSESGARKSFESSILFHVACSDVRSNSSYPMIFC
jgi:hypothetical protein